MPRAAFDIPPPAGAGAPGRPGAAAFTAVTDVTPAPSSEDATLSRPVSRPAPRAARSRGVPFAVAAALALLPGALPVAPAGLLGAQQPAAATGRVTGTVRNEGGQPLAGAQVTIQGTRLGSVTGADGRFTIGAVPAGSYTLRAQRIGFGAQTRPVTVAAGGAATVDVALAAVATQLSEVVAVGYTSETRREVTGAVATVAAEQIQDRKVARVEEAISGRLAGVQIQSSGEPGQASSIIVRGQNSLYSAEPLYVVDGLYLRQNPNLNPNDIATIQVLKDASAASQYGAQAANGVVVITTKRGQGGQQNRVGLQTYYGYQQPNQRVELMGAQEWARVTQQAYQNANTPLPQGVQDILSGRRTVDTDWLDAVQRNGSIQDHNLQVSGATATGSANYLLSGGYTRQVGTIINTDFDRYSFRVNSEARRGRFTLGENIAFARSNRDNLDLGGQGSPLIEAVRAVPGVPVRDSTTLSGYGFGSAYLPGFFDNPVGLLENRDVTRLTNQAFGTLYGAYQLPAGFNYRLNVGFTYDDLNDQDFRRANFNLIRQNNPVNPAEFRDTRDNGTSLLLENLLSFDRTFGRHAVNAVAGFTQQRTQRDSLTAYRRGFPDETRRELQAGLENQSNSGGTVESRLRSYLVRANYTLADRYLVTGTFRRDGSSRFNPANRWGNFGSGSVGWIVSEENFFKNSGAGRVLSFLKVRAGYGTLGNQDFADYQYLGLVAPNRSYPLGGDAIGSGSTQLNLVNPNIKWQENTEQNYGLDFNFLGDRLAFTADFYIRDAKDLLVRAPLPLSLGSQESPFVNAGSLRNRGFELGATHRLSRGRFELNTALNLTSIGNRVVSLGNGAQPIFAGGVSRTAVGEPLGHFWVYKTAGIFQTDGEVQAHRIQPQAQPGDVRYVDVNGDGVLNDNDRYNAGNPVPNLEGGLFFDGRFRALDFSVGFRGSYGNEIFNQARWWTDRLDDNANFRSGLQPWTPENRSTTTPRAIIGGGTQNALNAASNSRLNSDRFVEDGSYLRVQNIQLGYNLPSRLFRRTGLAPQSARLYVNVQNAFLFTGYQGFDPEFIGFSNQPGSLYTLERGVDFGRVYPTPRTFTVGLNLGL